MNEFSGFMSDPPSLSPPPPPPPHTQKVKRESEPTRQCRTHRHYWLKNDSLNSTQPRLVKREASARASTHHMEKSWIASVLQFRQLTVSINWWLGLVAHVSVLAWNTKLPDLFPNSPSHTPSIAFRRQMKDVVNQCLEFESIPILTAPPPPPPPPPPPATWSIHPSWSSPPNKMRMSLTVTVSVQAEFNQIL